MAHGIKEDKIAYVGPVSLGTASAPERFETQSGDATAGSTNLTNCRVTSVAISWTINKSGDGWFSGQVQVRLNGNLIYNQAQGSSGSTTIAVDTLLTSGSLVISIGHNSSSVGAYVSGSASATGYKLM